MPHKTEVSVFWFRRDLRLEDNSGLYHALKSGLPVIPLFIFDKEILDKLDDKADSRVTFIYNTILNLNNELQQLGSAMLIKHNTTTNAWKEILNEYSVSHVFTNTDYEPYAIQRDENIKKLLVDNRISFHEYKDQLIFEKCEVTKDDGKPYTVFTPYKRKWLEKFSNPFYSKSYSTTKYFSNFAHINQNTFIDLNKLGFNFSSNSFPDKEFKSIIANYSQTRNLPAIEGTSRLSVHLRFGTVSIRQVATNANLAIDKTWLSELIWRDFYAMILWHFPQISSKAFKPDYDNIRWRNNEIEFKAWCDGKTGYPIVDAGMRQLNTTGWMHNRVRMITASFLTKHLLIDWRWGEAYFAKKLIDYDMASNIGGWQWAAGSGNDAVPYFRVFNPQLQTERFDKDLKYIRQWIPEFDDPFKYPKPIVEHKFARQRALDTFKQALSS